MPPLKKKHKREENLRGKNDTISFVRVDVLV